MPSVEINGGRVVYEVLGEGDGIPVVLTPGGRAPRHLMRLLAERVAAAGTKVLIWDRPNAGESDIQFSDRWPSESHMHADTLQQLIKHLGWGRVVLAGASSGSRLSLITAIEYPEVCCGLVVWQVVGGVYATMSLADGYVLKNIAAARSGGMEAVLALPEWKQRIEQNPRNLERFQSLSSEDLIKVFRRWLTAFVPTPGQIIPGVRDEDIARIAVPTRIIRSDENEIEHPLQTCYELHALVKGSQLVDAPWPEDAWSEAFADTVKNGGSKLLELAAEVAPVIIDLCHSDAVATRALSATQP